MNMATMFLSGASDDLLETTIQGQVLFDNEGHDDVYGDEDYFPRIIGWYIEYPTGEHFRIEAHYDGVWSFSVNPPENMEDAPESFPDLEVKIRTSRMASYSTELEFEVPDGTTYRMVRSDG